MKKLIFTLLLSLCLFSCVDSEYDLSSLETDSMAIGNSDSEYRMPLVNIYVGAGELQNGSMDADELCSMVKVWLPDMLPNPDASKSGYVDYIDINALGSDALYAGRLIDELYLQLETDDQKMESIIDLVWENYKSDFVTLFNSFVPAGVPTPDYAGNKTLFVEAFKNIYKTAEGRAEVEDKFNHYLNRYLKIDTFKVNIGSINIDDGIVDMLTENLDPRNSTSSKNALYMYGTIESKLPLDVSLNPQLMSQYYDSYYDDYYGDDYGAQIVGFNVDVKNSAVSSFGTDNSIRLYADDLRNIVDGCYMRLPVTLNRFYPNKSITSGELIIMKISLLKRGGLKFNL